MPLDIAVTPFDNSKTHKEGVSRTYKGFDGYAPIMAYMGTEGFLINTELREGKQNCQKGTPAFLRETLGLCHKVTDAPLLVRMASGNDAAEKLGILLEADVLFLIKRNPRGAEPKAAWLAKVKGCCKDVRHPRNGKDVYIGSLWKAVNYIINNERKTISIRIVYEVIERTIDWYGQILLTPEIELNTWWTNLDWSDDGSIAANHAHGESEQFHSETKTDMDVERLPPGKFSTNELVLELARIAYKLLRMIRQESLKHKPDKKRRVTRRRIRTVITKLMLFACHITRHARKMVMALGRSNTWRWAFYQVWLRFAGV